MKEGCISVRDVSYEYNQQRCALEHVNFEIRDRDSVGIVGANGAGKSTLLRMLVGQETEYMGSIEIGGIHLSKENVSQISQQVGFVFQNADNQLFMSTVYEDVAFTPRSYGLPEIEVVERVNHALQFVRIAHLKDRPIYELSAGEKKLVSIAMILAMAPRIIVMDEPSVALDTKNRHNLINLMKRFNFTKIIASHDLDMILDTCQRTILLREGKVIRDGATSDILLDKELMEYCGLDLPERYMYLSRNGA